MALLTAKSSTIFIGTGADVRVYRSVEEVPPALRRKLQESTRGINAATILIADKRGREELVRALQAQPPQVQRRLSGTVLPPRPQERPKPGKRLPRASVRTWLELLLPVVIGASLWFFVESRF